MTTNRLNVDVFALISNIPNSFHSQDLRNYFSQFVEERRFKCFHFRNRPEQRLSKPVVKSTECGEVDNARPNAKSREDHVTANCRPDEESPRHSTDIPHASISSSGNSSRLNEVNGRPNSASTSDFKSNRKCCVIKIANINLKTALKLYHKKPWVDRSGNAMVSDNSNSDLVSFTRDDLNKLPELNPPEIMPNGNVGTPTQTFLKLIRDCKIPPSVIKKLDLSFPKRRSNRKYGNVPFQYGTSVNPGQCIEEVAVTGAGQEITDDLRDIHDITARKSSGKGSEGEYSESKEDGRIGGENSDSGEDDDDDTCEEWERHESLHDDVTKQDRTDERLFEEEMEIVWDKGSSGLVFYTDAAYWDAMKGACILLFYRWRNQRCKRLVTDSERGKDTEGRGGHSVFTKKKRIGQFEDHTKGVGRQLMNQMGWKDGDGLGRSKSGIPDALENEGQTPKDKKGFGYHGEKLCRYPVKKKQKTLATISTAYDDPQEIDPPTSLLRSNDPTYLKHRDKIV
ncbi:putative G patch domain-containing protein 3 [Apostichopus japonicus]|uniref:Putative G patch domain-containing protein 3 n=1 Tax=Stichopus japonicus TaxID=307972 RepID=A0A2G8KUJ4_STIJA|nr:putative G patch domain-containing protein 3 [Apostichopus japonicus]